MDRNEFSLSLKTRGGASPQGRAKVYLSYNMADGQRARRTAEQLLEAYDCAVWYYDYSNGLPDKEQLSDLIGEMQLFVVPVTLDYLLGGNGALDFELTFARDHAIPVLGILPDEALADCFIEKCGALPYIAEHTADGTLPPFEARLAEFLSAVLVSEETSARIRREFDASMFLAARKRDRSHALGLSRLIHFIPACRDIAILRDEFAKQGESFDASADLLSRSDIFALLVTPAVLERNESGDDNPLCATLYPAARESGMRLLSYEAEKTPHLLLKRRYRGIPTPVDAWEIEKLTADFKKKLKGLSLREKSGPMHEYLIGLAYLSGTDTERNPFFARDLIKNAATGGCAPAMRTLAVMYSAGTSAEREPAKAVEWQRKYAAECESALDSAVPGGLSELTGGDEDDTGVSSSRVKIGSEGFRALLRCTQARADLARMLENAGQNDEALSLLAGSVSLAEKLRFESTREHTALIADCLEEHARLACRCDKLRTARKRLERAEALRRSLFAEDPSDFYQELADDCRLISALLIKEGKPEEGEKELVSAIGLYREFNGEQPEICGEKLARCELELGDLYDSTGRLDEAEKRYMSACAVAEKLCAEDEARSGELLGDCCFRLFGLYAKLGRHDAAEEYMLSAVRQYERLASRESERGGILLAGRYNELGRYFKRTKGYEEALGCFDRALELLAPLEEAVPKTVRPLVAECSNNAGTCCARLKRSSDAIQYFTRAIGIYEELADGSGKYERELAANCCLVSIEYAERDRLQRAEELLLRSTDIYEKLLEKHTEGDIVDELVFELEQAYSFACRLYDRLGRPEGAKRAYVRGIEQLERLAARRSGNLDADQMIMLGEKCHDYAAFLLENGAAPDAEKYLLRACGLFEELAAGNPERFGSRLELIYHSMAKYYYQVGKKDAAELYWNKYKRIVH